jgi:hypothetical protein
LDEIWLCALSSKRVVRFQADKVAAVADRNYSINWQILAQRG